MYKAHKPTKERWIYISFDKYDYEEPDSFIKLVKAYKDNLSGKIVAVSELMQYKIDNDELGLLFQWDCCFGITVVIPEQTDLVKAYNAINNLCETLNKAIIITPNAD